MFIYFPKNSLGARPVMRLKRRMQLGGFHKACVVVGSVNFQNLLHNNSAKIRKKTEINR